MVIIQPRVHFTVFVSPTRRHSKTCMKSNGLQCCQLATNWSNGSNELGSVSKYDLFHCLSDH